uniref:Uncharacterized protein n=1 Tax=Magallana gigas TaxID=29159 RepID=K1RJQ5_MAGGI
MGLISQPGKAVYSAAESGIIGLSKGVALEGDPFGVTCNAIVLDTPTPLTMLHRGSCGGKLTLIQNTEETQKK